MRPALRQSTLVVTLSLVVLLLVTLEKASGGGYDITPSRSIEELGPGSVNSVFSGTGPAGADPDGNLYVGGGFSANGSTVTNRFAKIDLVAKKVTALSPMTTSRAEFGLAEGVDGKLYAMGGIDSNGKVIGAVEVYDTQSNRWSSAAPMITPRAGVAAVTGADGKIYAIGGTDASGNAVNTVEEYDPFFNTWIAAPSLQTPRSGFAACLGYDNKIYVAGGLNQNKALNSVEVFDESTRTWQSTQSMLVPRANFGLSLGPSGELIAEGGRNASGDLDSIEIYDASNHQWSLNPTPLPIPCSGYASVEASDGITYLVGGDHPPGQNAILNLQEQARPSHSIQFYLHDNDLAATDGAYTMSQEPPLSNSSAEMNFIGSRSWASFPALTGQLNAGATVTVVIPPCLGLDLLTQFQLAITDIQGGTTQVLGSTFQVLALGGESVQIPISTPINLNAKVLKLTISNLLGLNLDLSQQSPALQVNGFTGEP
jgi:hypothetical protein